jgi:hypothetical protein
LLIVGIDPGKQGAACSWNTLTGKQIQYKIPTLLGKWDAYAMADLVMQWKAGGTGLVVIEQCHPFPGSQAYSSAEVMYGYGLWLGTLHAAKMNVLIVPAQTWKKETGILVPIVKAGKKATAQEKALAYKLRKLKAVEMAESVFGLPFRTQRGRLLDGQAEAALLARWGGLKHAADTPAITG